MASRVEPLPDAMIQIERLELKLKRIELSEKSLGNVTEVMRREGRLFYPFTTSTYDSQMYMLYPDYKTATVQNDVIIMVMIGLKGCGM